MYLGALAPIHIVLSQTSSKREINIDISYWLLLLNPYPFMPNLREAKVYLGLLAALHIVLSQTSSKREINIAISYWLPLLNP